MLHQNRHVMYNHHIIRMHIAYLFIVYNKYEIILSPRPRSNSFHDPGTFSLHQPPTFARHAASCFTKWHAPFRIYTNTHAKSQNTSGIYAWRRDTARNETNSISSRRLSISLFTVRRCRSLCFDFFPFSQKNLDSATIHVEHVFRIRGQRVDLRLNSSFFSLTDVEVYLSKPRLYKSKTF